MCRRQMFLVSYLTHLMHLLENFIGRCNSDKKNSICQMHMMHEDC